MGIKFSLKRRFTHPKLVGVDLDDPRNTKLRRQIIRENPILSLIYRDWYETITAVIPDGNGCVLELGSGAGFLSEHIPALITSDIFFLDDMELILDGQRLPFSNDSLKAILMTNVLHHIPNVRAFLHEAARAVRPGGVISMVEPWVSTWSKLVYTQLHHEPFDPQAKSWEFPSSGPLSGANGALPWIIFQRDRDLFEQEFPDLHVECVIPIMPFSYLISGGFSTRPLLPKGSYRLINRLESLISPLMHHLAMFAHILIRRKDA